MVGPILEVVQAVWKWVLAVLLAVFLISRIGNFLGPSDQLQKSDVIIAVSGGDTPARTAKAIQLYKDHWANKIIFSGAALDPSSPSNADVMREAAIRSGIPGTNIIAEGFSADTAQNAINSLAYLRKLNAQRVILVTSGYHQRRAAMEFRQVLGPDVEIINQPVHERSWTSTWWTSLRGWWLALSELIKICIIWLRIKL